MLTVSPGVALEPPLREGETQGGLRYAQQGKQKNPVLPKGSCQVVCHAILEQFIVNTFQSVELIAANIPLKRNVSILWHALPRIDGCHRTTGELEAPFNVDFVGWIYGIVVLAWRTEHCDQLVICG